MVFSPFSMTAKMVTLLLVFSLCACAPESESASDFDNLDSMEIAAVDVDASLQTLQNKQASSDKKMDAILSLSGEKDPKIGPVLVDIIKNSNDQALKPLAITGVKHLENEPLFIEVLQYVMANEKDAFTRLYAIKATQSPFAKPLDPEKLGPVLTRALQDEAGTVRGSAVKALGALPYKAAVPAIQELLKTEKEEGVRTDAQAALAALEKS